jgi:hypothetical protein
MKLTEIEPLILLNLLRFNILVMLRITPENICWKLKTRKTKLQQKRRECSAGCQWPKLDRPTAKFLTPACAERTLNNKRLERNLQ